MISWCRRMFVGSPPSFVIHHVKSAVRGLAVRARSERLWPRPSDGPRAVFQVTRRAPAGMLVRRNAPGILAAGGRIVEGMKFRGEERRSQRPHPDGSTPEEFGAYLPARSEVGEMVRSVGMRIE